MRRLAFGIALVVLAGCSAESSSDSAGPSPIWNGQTGSLVPVCGLRAQELTLDDSSGRFVVDTGGCAPGTGPGAVSLTDGAGQPVTFSAVSLGNGKYLIVPSAALAPGDYSVSVAGMSRDVTVEQPVAKPTPARVGDLQQIAPQNCGFDLALTLDPATLANAPLLKLVVTIDGRSSTFRDFGEVTADDAVLELTCAHGCLGPGRHAVSVTGEIAGQTAALEGAAATIDVRCPSEIQDNGGACGFSRGPGSRFSALVALVALGLAAWRRSGARRESRGSSRGSPG